MDIPVEQQESATLQALLETPEAKEDLKKTHGHSVITAEDDKTKKDSHHEVTVEEIVDKSNHMDLLDHKLDGLDASQIIVTQSGDDSEMARLKRERTKSQVQKDGDLPFSPSKARNSTTKNQNIEQSVRMLTLNSRPTDPLFEEFENPTIQSFLDTLGGLSSEEDGAVDTQSASSSKKLKWGSGPNDRILKYAIDNAVIAFVNIKMLKTTRFDLNHGSKKIVVKPSGDWGWNFANFLKASREGLPPDQLDPVTYGLGGLPSVEAIDPNTGAPIDTSQLTDEERAKLDLKKRRRSTSDFQQQQRPKRQRVPVKCSGRRVNKEHASIQFFVGPTGEEEWLSLIDCKTRPNAYIRAVAEFEFQRCSGEEDSLTIPPMNNLPILTAVNSATQGIVPISIPASINSMLFSSSGLGSNTLPVMTSSTQVQNVSSQPVSVSSIVIPQLESEKKVVEST